jgi:hypothetical protein
MVHTGYPSFGPRSDAASARHSLSSLCRDGSSDPLFSPTTRPPAESDPFPLASFANRQTSQHSNLPTLLRSIPLRITFFAHHHPLTIIESFSYKNRGRGWVSRRTFPTQTVPSFYTSAECATRRKCRKPITFMRLLHNFRTPGVGGTSSLRGSLPSGSLRYPFPFLASPLRVNAGVPNEP